MTLGDWHTMLGLNPHHHPFLPGLHHAAAAAAAANGGFPHLPAAVAAAGGVPPGPPMPPPTTSSHGGPGGPMGSPHGPMPINMWPFFRNYITK